MYAKWSRESSESREPPPPPPPGEEGRRGGKGKRENNIIVRKNTTTSVTRARRVRELLYLYGVGDVPRGLPLVDLVPAASELASAARRVLVEAAVVHAERLRRRPLGQPVGGRAPVPFLHAAVRRQFRVARGPERVRVRPAARVGLLQPAPLGVRAVRPRGPGPRRGRGRLVAATLHDGLHARAVLGHVRLDRGPHHVHSGAQRRHVEPAEVGHGPPTAVMTTTL